MLMPIILTQHKERRSHVDAYERQVEVAEQTESSQRRKGGAEYSEIAQPRLAPNAVTHRDRHDHEANHDENGHAEERGYGHGVGLQFCFQCLGHEECQFNVFHVQGL